MSNPALTPLFIVLLGFAWNVSCEMIVSLLCKGRQFSPRSAFWVRQIGFLGLGAAILIGLIWQWL
jgi:hypothetical protein